MKLKRRHREMEVSTESLNDIMFFLLLFFLIISTLVNPSVIKLNLPNSKSSQQVDTNPVTIDVTKDLQYYLNNKPVQFGNLEKEIAYALQTKSTPTIILRFDNSLTVQDLVDLLQIGDRLKVKMVLATKPPNG
jgi:biopolymer transport protein ExbD